MKLRSIALASSAIVLYAGMMGTGYAKVESPARDEISQTQQLNKNELTRVTVGHHVRHFRHEAARGTQDKYAVTQKGSERSEKTASNDNSTINPETGKTAGTAHNVAGRIAANIGNKIMRVMYTKRAPFTDSELRKGLLLREVGQPQQTLSTASVETREGYVLGEVKVVRLNASGDPKEVGVVTGGFLGVGQHVVQIGASDFVYLPDRNILVTNMAKEDVNKLPAVKNS